MTGIVTLPCSEAASNGELCTMLGCAVIRGFEPLCAALALPEPVKGLASGLAPRMGWNSLFVHFYQLHALLLGHASCSSVDQLTCWIRVSSSRAAERHPRCC